MNPAQVAEHGTAILDDAKEELGSHIKAAEKLSGVLTMLTAVRQDGMNMELDSALALAEQGREAVHELLEVYSSGNVLSTVPSDIQAVVSEVQDLANVVGLGRPHATLGDDKEALQCAAAEFRAHLGTASRELVDLDDPAKLPLHAAHNIWRAVMAHPDTQAMEQVALGEFDIDDVVTTETLTTRMAFSTFPIRERLVELEQNPILEKAYQRILETGKELEEPRQLIRSAQTALMWLGYDQATGDFRNLDNLNALKDRLPDNEQTKAVVEVAERLIGCKAKQGDLLKTQGKLDKNREAISEYRRVYLIPTTKHLYDVIIAPVKEFPSALEQERGFPSEVDFLTNRLKTDLDDHLLAIETADHAGVVRLVHMTDLTAYLDPFCRLAASVNAGLGNSPETFEAENQRLDRRIEEQTAELRELYNKLGDEPEGVLMKQVTGLIKAGQPNRSRVVSEDDILMYVGTGSKTVEAFRTATSDINRLQSGLENLGTLLVERALGEYHLNPQVRAFYTRFLEETRNTLRDRMGFEMNGEADGPLWIAADSAVTRIEAEIPSRFARALTRDAVVLPEDEEAKTTMRKGITFALTITPIQERRTQEGRTADKVLGVSILRPEDLDGVLPAFVIEGALESDECFNLDPDYMLAFGVGLTDCEKMPSQDQVERFGSLYAAHLGLGLEEAYKMWAAEDESTGRVLRPKLKFVVSGDVGHISPDNPPAAEPE